MDESDVLNSFCCMDIEVKEKRLICHGCGRPETVCWCPFLPKDQVQVTTGVIILQHKYEEKRRLKTAPMLHRSLEPGQCTILQGSRFPLSKNAFLSEVCSLPNTVLLYPSSDAIDVQDFIPVLGQPKTLILLDGTWPQTKGMYMKNHWLHSLKQVKLSHNETSKYVIRTQPTETSLSTLESAAIALSLLEKRPEIVQILVEPLRGMCEFQLQYGAVEHQSKEYLVRNGLYKKQEVKPWDKVGRSRPRNRAKKNNLTKHNEPAGTTLSDHVKEKT